MAVRHARGHFHDLGAPCLFPVKIIVKGGEGVLLYHGSNVVVEKPRLFKSDRRVDFGPGFYLTSSMDQAKRWARVVTRRRQNGLPIVSVFEFDEAMCPDIRLLAFDSASVEWLRYVGRNRNGEAVDGRHDIVVGPVANDNTMPTLRMFFAGVYTEEEAIKRLLPQKLHDQYAFKTDRALGALTFREVVNCE